MTARRPWAAALLLVALTALVYAPVVRFPFVDFDDPFYVADNADLHALHGTAALRYACTTTLGGNWQPLVWLSYFADRDGFHLRPGPMHAENVALHAASAVLVLLLLTDATGRPGRSLACAALFAVHPLHVESVAWISERKDALSTPLLLATMCCYVRLAKTGGWRWCGSMLLCYGLSLSAKSMGVTLPAVLLLLDAWPLNRLGHELHGGGHSGRAAGFSWQRLPAEAGSPAKSFAPMSGQSWTNLGRAIWPRLLEKLPLLAMAIAAAAGAVVAQQSVGATAAVATTAADRLGNAAVATVQYLIDCVWPADLSVFYPYRPAPTAAALAAAAALALVTVVAVRAGRRRPYLLVGWLWFCGTLLPVSGAVVQVGMQSRADRYVYFPSIGLSVAVVWLTADALAKHLRPVVATAAVAALAVAGRRQVDLWRDNDTLFAHAVAVTDGNYLALDQVARGEMDRDLPKAVSDLTAALAARPDFAPAYADLGRCARRAGRPAEAVAAFAAAAHYAPSVPAYQHALAVAQAEAAAAPHR